LRREWAPDLQDRPDGVEPQAAGFPKEAGRRSSGLLASLTWRR
jgi:hypothetical protein